MARKTQRAPERTKPSEIKAARPSIPAMALFALATMFLVISLWLLLWVR